MGSRTEHFSKRSIIFLKAHKITISFFQSRSSTLLCLSGNERGGGHNNQLSKSFQV